MASAAAIAVATADEMSLACIAYILNLKDPAQPADRAKRISERAERNLLTFVC